MAILRQLLDIESSTYTYILGDELTREGAIIDSVDIHFDRDSTFLKELGLTLKYVFETHVHADHITAAAKLRSQTGATTICSEKAGIRCADRTARDGDIFRLGEKEILVFETPGHTNGCLSFLFDGSVFTGDSLMIRSAGRTDFQEGSAKTLFHSVMKKLYTLPPKTRVYPGHDYGGRTMSTIEEEMAWNKRIPATQNENDFVNLMNSLKLPPPKKLAESVPANKECGNVPRGGPATG